MRKDCWIRWKDSSFSCHFSALNSITYRLWWDLRKAIQLQAMQFPLNDGSRLPVLVTVIATVEDAQRRDWWMVIRAPAAAHTSAVARRWKCHSPRISNRSDAQNQWPGRPRPTRRNQANTAIVGPWPVGTRWAKVQNYFPPLLSTLTFFPRWEQNWNIFFLHELNKTISEFTVIYAIYELLH